MVAEELSARGVELAGPLVAGERTGTVVALVAPDGTRTLASDRGASGTLGPGDVDASMADGADVLHVAGYTLLRDPGPRRCLANAARRYGARVTVDPSTAHGIAELGREEMRRRVSALAPDVVFANEAEAAAFGEPLGCAWVVKRGALGRTVRQAGEVVSTRGSRSPRRRHHGRRRRLCRGLRARARPRRAAQRGQAAAARCVTLVGALP